MAIVDTICDTCKGEGSVLNPFSGDDEHCIKCNGTGETHKMLSEHVVLIYSEGGQIQHVAATENIAVLVFDDMEDEYAAKKFGHILSQMNFGDIAW